MKSNMLNELRAFMDRYDNDDIHPKTYLWNMIDDYADLYEKCEKMRIQIRELEEEWSVLDAKLPVKDFAESVLIEGRMMKILAIKRDIEQPWEQAKLNKSELKDKIRNFLNIIFNREEHMERIGEVEDQLVEEFMTV